MINYEIPVSGKVLRGGKGLIARTNKAILYVTSKEAQETAMLKYGNKCKIVVVKDLNSI